VTIPFVKMHGAANDFVVIDHREPFLAADSGALFARMCDRRRGIGADGVLLLERDAGTDFAMRYFNADGGHAVYCGNGARCLARFGLDLGLGAAGRIRFRTAAGIQSAVRLEGGRLTVAFGAIAPPEATEALDAAGRRFEGDRVVAGVPHFVTAAGPLAGVPIAEWGAALRRHPRFGPEGANVDFVEARGPGRIAMRTYERGVEGETLACGSGAIASAAWAFARGAASPMTVLTAGGDALIVSFEKEGAGPDGGLWRVELTGPAVVAFHGTWSDEAPAGVPPAAGHREA
jgi:diaminopimelate epimerase